MLRTGSINTNISFPIICIVEDSFSVCQQISEYTICKRAYIPILLKLNEFIIDSNGFYYKRNEVVYSKYINAFWGFSLKFAGFGVCYVDKKIELLMELSVESLKETGFRILKSKEGNFSATQLNIKKLISEFKDLTEREDVMRCLFYFCDPGRYHPPSLKDISWRQNLGFPKQ